MIEPVVERVLASSRYGNVDPGLVRRLADEELTRARNVDDAVKRVKRRLHQAVGAFSAASRQADPLLEVRRAWNGDMANPAFRAACVAVMQRHASTAERISVLDGFHDTIWSMTGVPRTLLDVGCGLHPLSLPWMDLGDARYVATDVDGGALAIAHAFLDLVGQPHDALLADAIDAPTPEPAEVALLLKLVPTLDRQGAGAAARLLETLQARHAVVTFPSRSLGGRAKGMERSYRARLDQLAADVDRVGDVAEASVEGELVFVLSLDG